MQQFTAAHAVSTPLVTVRTFDAKSTIDRLRANVKENIGVVVWDCVTGMHSKNKPGLAMLTAAINNAQSSQELTPQLQESLRIASMIGEDCLLILSNAHLFWNEPAAIQGIWNLRDSFKAWGSMLVLLTGNGAILPAELSNDFLVLDEPLPTNNELGEIVKNTFEFAKLPAPAEKTVSDAVIALTGLPAFTAEQSAAMSLAIAPGGKSGNLDINGLWERKRQAVNQTRGLQVLQTDASLDNIGGLEQFKEYLERIMNGKEPPNVILLWDEIEKSFAGMGTDTSGTTTKMGGNVLSWAQDTGMRGIIALGVPGAGKSEIVKAIGNKYGIPVIAFNLADMEHGIVGSSNEYLRNAQAIIDAISDKRVLSVATCNKIDSLSPEIQRRFATEGIFFFDAPTSIDRESIWDVYRTKYSIPADDITPPDNGWTGAEIKNCALKAYRLQIPLVEASKYIIPVTVSNAGTIEALRRASSDKYLSASTAGRFVYAGQETPIEAQETPSGRKMR
jgi:hypothetical protein